MEKELRDRKVMDLYNSGVAERKIAEEMGIGKSTVNRIIQSFIKTGNDDIPPKEVVPVKLKGTEERFTNFSGYERLDVNVYSHKETGEIVQIAFVKAKSKDDFGYFVKLNN